MITKNELVELRRTFDSRAKERNLSPATVKRYQSWMRRFIKYLLEYGLDISQEASVHFILSYKSHFTRRQAYYALRFLFQELMGKEFHPEILHELDLKKRKRTQRAKRRKWFYWW